METIYKDYRNTKVDQRANEKVFYGLIKENNILKRFKKATPETLVESGYTSAHYDNRVKKLEVASCLLHLTILLFSFAYVT